MTKVRKLPDSELEIMQIIWSLDAPVARNTIEEHIAQKHPMAQTTLLTLISRLNKKGFIRADKNGRSSEYTPLVSKNDYLAYESSDFFDKVCGGSINAFASALMESSLSDEDIAELRELLSKGEL